MLRFPRVGTGAAAVALPEDEAGGRGMCDFFEEVLWPPATALLKPGGSGTRAAGMPGAEDMLLERRGATAAALFVPMERRLAIANKVVDVDSGNRSDAGRVMFETTTTACCTCAWLFCTATRCWWRQRRRKRAVVHVTRCFFCHSLHCPGRRRCRSRRRCPTQTSCPSYKMCQQRQSCQVLRVRTVEVLGSGTRTGQIGRSSGLSSIVFDSQDCQIEVRGRRAVRGA